MGTAALGYYKTLNSFITVDRRRLACENFCFTLTLKLL